LYHPAAALYDGSLRNVQLADFKILKKLFDSESNLGNQSNGPTGGTSEQLQKWM